MLIVILSKKVRTAQRSI